jgi:hypothetical protein
MPKGVLPDLPQGVKLRFGYTFNTRPVFNVMYLKYSTSAPSVAELNTLSGLVMSAWTTNIKPVLLTSMALNFVDLQDVSSRTGSYYQNTTGGTGSVTVVNSLPSSIAMAISLKVAKRYRGGHGRVYMCGFNIADVVGGNNWAAARLNAVNTAWTNYITASNAFTAGSNTYTAVVGSFYTHDASKNQIFKTPPETYPIIGVSVHSRVDTQRRRLGKEIS